MHTFKTKSVKTSCTQLYFSNLVIGIVSMASSLWDQCKYEVKRIRLKQQSFALENKEKLFESDLKAHIDWTNWKKHCKMKVSKHLKLIKGG